MKKILRIVLFIIIVIVIVFGLLIAYASWTDYNPHEKEIVLENKSPDMIADSARLSLLIWNIGYAGLDATMDFFYDGGQQVRPDEAQVNENMTAIVDFLAQHKQKDVIMLQEADKSAKRSYRLNQYRTISSSLSGFTPSFGKNYDVFFIPVPFHSPYGKVEAGIMTLSKPKPENVVRYSFPGNYAWPKNLFMLDRCFMVNTYPVSNGKKLLIVNTHNSAYDDGSLRKKQMEYMKEFLVSEYEKGNYIVVGGDWNQCPPQFKHEFSENVFDTIHVSYIAANYLSEGWTWFFDRHVPTNRRLYAPYNPESTRTTVIDFYLLSPNIKPVSIKTINLKFKHSDHQPVEAIIELIP